MDLEFSLMDYEDLDEVLAIERASFITPWTRLMFLSEFEKNGISHIYVARSKGIKNRTILGYIVLWHLGEEAQIANIATHPGYLRKGIGEKILKFSLQKIKEMGAIEVFLEVRVSNIAARDLYGKSGFKNFGIRKKYYADTGEDAILMKKALNL